MLSCSELGNILCKIAPINKRHIYAAKEELRPTTPTEDAWWVTLGAIGNIVTIHYGNDLELKASSEGTVHTNRELHSHFSLYHFRPGPTHANPENDNTFTFG